MAEVNVKETKSFGKDVMQSYNNDHAPLAAAAVAFYLLLSMVPLLLLLISVAAFFINPAQVQSLVGSATATLGAGVGDAVRTQLLSIVNNRGLLTGISLLVGLWAGSQIFAFIEMALNQIWDAEEKRSFWVQRGLALLMVPIVGVLLALAVGATYLVHIIGALQIPVLGRVGELPWFIVIFTNFVLPALLATAVFTIIYRYLSARRVPWKLAATGAVIAGVLWALVLQAFSWYTANMADYNALYGSLGGLILLMLLFNYSAQIMLLGAEIIGVMHDRRAIASGKDEERWEEAGIIGDEDTGKDKRKAA